MNRNNIYTVNPLYNGLVTPLVDEATSGGTTIIYQQGGGGGGGLTDALKLKLDGIQEGAEVNQNAYSKVRLNNNDTLILEATSKTATLNLSGVYPVLVAINQAGGLDFTVSSDSTNNTAVVTQKQLADALAKLEEDKYWKLDADGKLYTELDVYSQKEVSAYGAGPGGGGTGGASALYELVDVLRDGDKVQGSAVGSILSYNGSHWYAIPQSAITPDLTNYATKSYVTQLINDLIGGAPGTLDTLKEIAEALGNDPNFAATMTDMINKIGLRVTDLEGRMASFDDMFEWDKTASASDASLWRIKAKKDLYGVGEISAYGYSSGTVPTGAQYMYELKDVLFTELTSGQLLQWNGTKWINIDKNAVGLNESELAKYLTTNNYAKKADITWANLLNKPTTWAWADITGKPTTLAGYGITDGVPNTRRVSAGSGLSGGGVLSSDVTISLGTIGTAGTYTKVTTDMYGRVVSGTTLSESDIPTLLISKISGLQTALDSKLNTSDFSTWFTINKNASGLVISIQANFDFFGVGEISAYGLGETQPSIYTLAGLDDVTITSPSNGQTLIYDSATSQWKNGTIIGGGNISLNGTVYSPVNGTITLPNLATPGDITAALNGYATQSWVSNQGFLTTASLGNYVTLNTSQTITATKSFTLTIKFANGVGGITLNSSSATDSNLIVGNFVNNAVAYVEAKGYKIPSGTSSQFLKADGSVDGNLYALAINGDQNYVNSSNFANLLRVQDTRSDVPKPNTYATHTITATFNASNGMPDGNWWSGFHVRGWGDGYCTWELVGPSSTNNTAYNLRYRTGIGDTWGAWKMIMTDVEADGKYVIKTGDTMTGTLTISADAINPPSLSANPKLQFTAANSSQPVALVYTDFDAYRPPAGLKLMGNQGGEWFEAPWILGRKFSPSRVATEYTSGTGFVANYFGLDAVMNNGNSSTTGIIKIQLPVSWTNTMGVYKIMLYEYTSRGGSEITVSFYNYSSSESYYNYSYQVNGGFEGAVRLAYDGSRCCILLGNTSYTWAYPKVFVHQIFGGQNTPANYVDQPFNISMITSESGLSKITSVQKTSMNLYDLNYMRIIDKSGYYGMAIAGYNDNVYIRAPRLGIIPYSSGNPGEGMLGTEGWQFSHVYANQIKTQRVSSVTNNLYIGSSGNSGWVYCQDLCSANGAAEAYWSIRTNGTAVFTNLTSKNVITGSVSGYSTYFPTLYIGGTQANPQTYFTQQMGLRVAMTGIGWSGTWGDTLWINGYSGGDVLPMCTLHFIRNGTPRFGISTQNSNGTSYGTNYEVWTAYNSNKAGVNWSAETFFAGSGVKSRNICIEVNNNGVAGDCSSEINNWNSHLYLQHKSNTNVLMCTGGGKVLIGSIDATYKLNVQGDIRATSWIRTDGATGWYSQSYGGGIYMTDSDQVQVYNNKVFYNTGYRGWGIGGHFVALKLYNASHIGLNLANNSYTWGIYSNNNGNMYIGRRDGNVNNSSGTYVVTIGLSTFSMSGNIVASGEVTAYSDARLKSSITDLKIRGRLKPKTYVKDGKWSIGFIAQEVQALYPELVHIGTEPEHYLSLNYGNITAVLAALINTVEDEVTTLKNKVKQLESEVTRLNALLPSQGIQRVS